MTFSCEHCAKSFRKENSLVAHACEPRRRWNDRNTVVVQLALQTYQLFYQRIQPSSKPKDWAEFASSRYYIAFKKFAQYTIDVRCVNTQEFINYILKQQTPLDRWCSDSVYEEFMLSWIQTEPAWDAVQRSLLTASDWADQQASDTAHYFKYATDSRVVSDIVKGRISAWLIYASADGVGWLSRLMPDQQQLIYRWINPEVWQSKLHQESEFVEIQHLLAQVGM